MSEKVYFKVEALVGRPAVYMVFCSALGWKSAVFNIWDNYAHMLFAIQFLCTVLNGAFFYALN